MKEQSLRLLYLKEIYKAIINATNGFTEYILRNTFEGIDKPEPLKDDLIGNMNSPRDCTAAEMWMSFILTATDEGAVAVSIKYTGYDDKNC